MDRQASILMQDAFRCVQGKFMTYEEAQMQWNEGNIPFERVSEAAKKAETEAMSAHWDNYRDGRRRASLLNYPGLDHAWGRSVSDLYEGLTRAESSMLLQIRTEAIGLNSHLHKIGRSDTPNCLCGAERQTAAHLIASCPLLDEHRRTLSTDGESLTQLPSDKTRVRELVSWAIRHFPIQAYEAERIQGVAQEAAQASLRASITTG